MVSIDMRGLNPMITELQNKRIEKAISHIGAIVADVLEVTQKTKELSVSAEAMLITVQQELEELYVSIGDVAYKSE